MSRPWQDRAATEQGARLHGGYAPRMCKCGAMSDEHDMQEDLTLVCERTECKGFEEAECAQADVGR